MKDVVALALGFLYLCHGAQADNVTYSSAVELAHVAGKFRLFSGKISWGHGQKEQAVTAIPEDEHRGEIVLLWQIREGSTAPPPGAGTPVLCGDIVALQHVDSGQLLKISSDSSAMHTGLRVSAGPLDAAENDFLVKCHGPHSIWACEHGVSLLHIATGTYLSGHPQRRYNWENCPGCPIVGHMEVFGGRTTAAGAQWTAKLGMLIQRDAKPSRDEL